MKNSDDEIVDLASIRLIKRHDRDHFFKYTTTSTFHKILESKKIRYTNPKNFNDPFDVQSGFHIDIDFENIEQKFIEKMRNIILDKNEPKLIENGPLNQSIKLAREKLPTHGIPSGLLEDMARFYLSGVIPNLLTNVDGMRNESNNIRDRSMMLCMTTKDDNILMWSHYANYHEGIVFKMKVAETEEEDDPLWLAQKVEYVNQAVPFYTTDQFLNQSIGLEKLSFMDYVRRAHLFKFKIWVYEDEYRYYDLAENPVDYQDLPFNIGKIKEVIFGCKCEENDRIETMELVKNMGLDIKFYEMEKHPFEFKLIKKAMT